MQQGRKYVVHAHIDEDSYRIVGSAKVERYLSKEHPDYQQGQEVNILIWQKTDLGFKAIVENKFSGLLYQNEIFQPVETGMQLRAYVKQVREDGKIDLALQQDGVKKVEDFSGVLLEYIKGKDSAGRRRNPSCLTGTFPIKYRKTPMNKWGVSIVGERDFPYFCAIRTNKLKTV